jgi:hypothetical protein
MEALRASLQACLAVGEALLVDRRGLLEVLRKEEGLLNKLEALGVALQDTAALARDGKGEGKVRAVGA